MQSATANGICGLSGPVGSAGLAPGEAAGPIVPSDKRLAGFLAARSDVNGDMGGPDRVIPAAPIAELIERAGRRLSSAGTTTGRRAKRKITPRRVEGVFFAVFATHMEGEQKKRRLRL